MQIVAASDLHLDRDAAEALVAVTDQVDLLIVAGDFAQRREGLAPYMAIFEPVADRAVFVAGNNESVEELRAASSATVLHGEVAERGGVRIAGIGGAIPPLPPLPWASWDIAEADAAELLSPITSCDVLVSHSPPQGVADRHLAMGHIGSTAVRDAAERLRPKFLLCGHVHDDWGTQGDIGDTRVINLGPAPVFLEVAP